MFTMITYLLILFFATTRSVVQPLDCDKYDGPLQILIPEIARTTGDVELRYLRLGKFSDTDTQSSAGGFMRSNGYELIYKVPDNKCTAINGCGVHPKDNVIYCHCSGQGGGLTGSSKAGRRPNTIVRFDENTIEQVMVIPQHSFSADFAPDGTMFAITADGKVYKYSGLNTATPTATYLHTVPVTPFDIVIIKADMIGDGVERGYAVGMSSKKRIYYTALEEGCYGGKCQYLVFADAGPGNEGQQGAIYGGAYKFGEELYFSDNAGVGIYKLLGAQEGKDVKMWYVLGSARTDHNDGLYCPAKSWPPPPALDCTKYNSPMQLIGHRGTFKVAMLKFGKDGKENYFETLWPLPEHNCNVVNACGVHPHDDVIYCHCQNDDLNRIIRFNQAYVEYVMEVKEKSFAGTFDIDGTFYYISQSDKMYKVEDINGVKGQEPVEVFMYDVGEKYLPMDIVTAEIDLQGDGNPKRYAVGLRRDNEVHIFPLGEDCYGMEGCYELQIAPGDKVPDKAVFGAAFAYEEHLFFSDNDGVGGIYEVEFDTNGKASLHVVSTNSAAHKNDGMFCYDVESPIGPLLDVLPLNPTDAKSVKVNVEAYKVQLGYDTVVYGLALIGMFATAYFATQQCHKFKLQVQFDEIEQSEL